MTQKPSGVITLPPYVTYQAASEIRYAYEEFDPVDVTTFGDTERTYLVGRRRAQVPTWTPGGRLWADIHLEQLNWAFLASMIALVVSVLLVVHP